jgi:hypothetical protein
MNRSMLWYNSHVLVYNLAFKFHAIFSSTRACADVFPRCCRWQLVGHTADDSKWVYIARPSRRLKPKSQNTTQKSISIAFCVSSIRHDSSLSKYRKQKQSPPWTYAILSISRGGLLLLTVLAEWRIMTNRAYAKSNGDGLLCSILCRSAKQGQNGGNDRTLHETT